MEHRQVAKASEMPVVIHSIAIHSTEMVSVWVAKQLINSRQNLFGVQKQQFDPSVCQIHAQSLTLESLEAKYVHTKYKHIGITALIYCKTSKISSIKGLSLSK